MEAFLSVVEERSGDAQRVIAAPACKAEGRESCCEKYKQIFVLRALRPRTRTRNTSLPLPN